MRAYKVTDVDGRDFHSGTVDYRDAIGWDLEVYDEPGAPRLCSKNVLHASERLIDALSYGRLPCAAFEVEGNPAVIGPDKAGFTRLHVVRECRRPWQVVVRLEAMSRRPIGGAAA